MAAAPVQVAPTDLPMEKRVSTLPKTLADYLANPVAQTKWVDGYIVEKVGQTLGDAKLQTRLLFRWAGYVEHQQLGGMVLVEAPCQTTGKVRRPDVAYLSPDLIQQFGEDIATLLQSYPLVEEIFSPTDCGEDIFLESPRVSQLRCTGSLADFSQKQIRFYPNSRWPSLAS